MNESHLQMLNELAPERAAEMLRHCCGCDAWCEGLSMWRPFADVAAVHAAADVVFDRLARRDWIQAFACHPKIGDLDSLRMKFVGNQQWSSGEQSGISEADEQTILALAQDNRAYEERFGYIFIVCASGKSAAEMLALLRARLQNDPQAELRIAAAQQRQITHLRIDKLLDPHD